MFNSIHASIPESLCVSLAKCAWLITVNSGTSSTKSSEMFANVRAHVRHSISVLAITSPRVDDCPWPPLPFATPGCRCPHASAKYHRNHPLRPRRTPPTWLPRGLRNADVARCSSADLLICLWMPFQGSLYNSTGHMCRHRTPPTSPYLTHSSDHPHTIVPLVSTHCRLTQSRNLCILLLEISLILRMRHLCLKRLR